MKAHQLAAVIILSTAASMNAYAAQGGVGHGSTGGMMFHTRAQACEVAINSAEADAINQAKRKATNKYGNANYNIIEKKCECNSNKDGTKWECTGFAVWEAREEK